MPESIESFVRKLQEEGVSAGKQAAGKIRKEAEEEAENLIADAKARADQIIGKAKKEADRQFFRMQTELELAVRDVVLKVRETIERVLSEMLTRKTGQRLSDPNFLGQIIREVVTAYATADASQQEGIHINISDRFSDHFNEDVIQNLLQDLKEEPERIKCQTTFSKAGFEYQMDGATVEVSPDSISEMISEIVGPDLQKMLDKLFGNPAGMVSESHPENETAIASENSISDSQTDSAAGKNAAEDDPS